MTAPPGSARSNSTTARRAGKAASSPNRHVLAPPDAAAGQGPAHDRITGSGPNAEIQRGTERADSPPGRRNRPVQGTQAASKAFGGADVSVDRSTDLLADLDALAEDLSGRFVVQVIVDAAQGHRRTHIYRSCSAAERAVERARERGQTAHVSLVRMLPVGVVIGLGGGR